MTEKADQTADSREKGYLSHMLQFDALRKKISDELTPDLVVQFDL